MGGLIATDAERREIASMARAIKAAASRIQEKVPYNCTKKSIREDLFRISEAVTDMNNKLEQLKELD